MPGGSRRRMCDQADGPWPLSVVVSDTGRVRQVLCPVLVGRDEEIRHLQAALAAAEAGRGGTVLITGEAGIGKSRLVRETARAAAARGLRGADRPGGGRGRADAVPAVRRGAGLGRAGGPPARQPANWIRSGRRWAGWFPSGGSRRQSSREESLVFLGEAVLRLLRVLSPEAGCLLVLEDLHWADRETLALLEYLADNLGRGAGAVRRHPARGGRRRRQPGLAGALEARGSAAVLPLGRLDPAAMAAMALACVGAAELPGAVQSLVAERAEGIPFLVEEVLAGLIGDGALTERDGRWHAGDLAAAGVPATFADAVRRRLDGLDADSRRVICAAAVLGRRFDWALLGPVTGLPDAAVVAALRRGGGPAAGRGRPGQLPVPARADA